MNINEVNPFGVSRTLQTEVQELAGEIAHAPISPRKYHVLAKKLDHAFASLQDLEAHSKAISLFIQAQTDALKEQVVKLYGDLENEFVKREITQIKEESTSLKKGRLTLKAIKQLEMHISDLESKHLTSIPDRRVIADAKQALLEAKAKLEGKPVLNHMQFLAAQKSVQYLEVFEVTPDEIEELFDIARAVYNADFGQAKKRYLSVSEDHKRKFERHMQNLMATPFTDSVETMQALIATANELAQNGEGYPSSTEIHQLFLGLSREEGVVQEGVSAQSKVVSLKFNN